MKNIGEERKIVSYLPLGLTDVTIFPTVVHQRLASSEGLEKVIRGGGEWEPIKIPQGNLAYITKSIRRPALLTRPRLHSYSQAIGLRTGLGNTMETRIGGSRNTCEIDDKNQIEEQFISSQAFHRTPGGCIREITAGERFEPRILESFGLVTQELHRLLPAAIHNNPTIQTTEKIEANGSCKSCMDNLQSPNWHWKLRAGEPHVSRGNIVRSREDFRP
jgi:hypothetical protein